MGTPFGETQRLVAAAAIEIRIGELAKASHVGLPCCTWNLGQGMDHSGPHRLDIHLADASIKMYFADCELAAMSAGKEWQGLQARLQQSLGKLKDQEFAAQYRPASVSPHQLSIY